AARAAHGPRKGFNPLSKSGFITFYSSPNLRTTGGTKGRVPFKGRKVTYVRSDPRVCVRRIAPAGDAQPRMASQAREAPSRRVAGIEPRRPARRRTVRSGEAIRISQLARAQIARRFSDSRWPAVRRRAQRRPRATGSAPRRASRQAL